jgi:hypothetical protein
VTDDEGSSLGGGGEISRERFDEDSHEYEGTRRELLAIAAKYSVDAAAIRAQQADFTESE